MRKTIRALRVDAILAVNVHGVTVSNNVSVLVASNVRAVLRLDTRVGAQEGARTVEHFAAQKVLVDVGIEQIVLVDAVLLWPRPSLRGTGAVVHHGIGARRAGHHGDVVGHGIVVHDARGRLRPQSESAAAEEMASVSEEVFGCGSWAVDGAGRCWQVRPGLAPGRGEIE